MPGALIKPVTRRAFNFLIPRTGQRHDRIVDMLEIWIRGWEEGKLAVEIGEEIWQNLKSRSPILKERAEFFLRALRSGCGVGDYLAWYMSTGGRWEDDPTKIGPGLLVAPEDELGHECSAKNEEDRLSSAQH